MIIFILLVVFAAIAVGYFFYRQKQSITGNHYRKNTKKSSPAQKDQIPIDDDAVLGIKKSSSPTTGKLPPIILYLMASENAVYGGYELLQALLSAGLRYGQHHIFHRHENKDGRGEVLFHCASAEKPGTFDPSTMGNFKTRGLCFFFSADKNPDPLSTFDFLLDTLDQFIEDLGGVVHDDQHQALTKETMIKYRQRIRSIESRKMTADLFAEI